MSVPNDPMSLKIEETPAEERPSQTSAERQERHKDLVDSFDRLVKPLDQILALMQGHATAQRRLFAITASIALLVIVAAVYQFRTALRISALEQQLASLSKTGEETKTKVAETEKKLDEDKLRALLAPEVRVRPGSNGSPNQAVLIVKSAPSAQASAQPSSSWTPASHVPHEYAFEIGQVEP
jgi:hypothetical protein